MTLQASSATADCTMKSYVQALFTPAITAMVFLAENSTLSTVTAVLVILAVIVTEEWRGWCGDVGGGAGGEEDCSHSQ